MLKGRNGEAKYLGRLDLYNINYIILEIYFYYIN